ncbi:MAG: hypothetical protein JNM39_17070 [Bdellovibrionaceae bacterium]|nr:hypothetical protein [Pseudobdellovibrionaceae bacterium]
MVTLGLAFRLFLPILASTVFAAPPVSEKSDIGTKKNHLEELFIWKVSEELKLSTGDEKKFSDTLRSLSAQKQAISQKLEDLTGLFIHAKTDAERKKQFAAYRKALIDYNNLALDELDQMKGIFGMQKMAHYMEVKIDITNKIKALISSPDKSGKDKKLLPAPKVIEE